jgi:uncharacterized protein YicC (UPF0701 family)
MKVEREEIDESEWATIQNVIEEALQNILNFRKDEGESLEKEFQLRIGNIRQFMNEALALDPERVQAIKERLQTAIAELQVNVDEKLKSIMQNIHEACVKYGTEADGYVNYVKGANVAGFMKVANAMMAQGIV